MMMTELEHARQYLSLQINEVVCWWWCYIREISWQLLIALVAYLCVCVFLYAVLKRVGHAAWQLPGPPGRLLLVTAHPDDEVMFFGPLVYWLARSKASEVYLLCLSMGTCLVITSVPATCSKIARLTIRRVPTGATNKLKPSTANAVSIEVHQCACRWGQKENRRAVGMYEGAGHPSSQCNDYYVSVPSVVAREHSNCSVSDVTAPLLCLHV
ncbi:hypothetical protein DMN91_011455 [Ooceraea biroi]|uniref:N-acetylglucosaminylphosphatidylinositol deacetylase n=1 Tax=Ooceraea biroi TaxID=2015173 RepID=A0A3L8D5M4_OOCBI|nr:hypothetical protein DMN91_011455 [Ooceraea biroi]